MVSSGCWERELTHVPRKEQAQGRESVFVSTIISLNCIALYIYSSMFLRIIALDPDRKVVIIPILQMRKWGFRKLK